MITLYEQSFTKADIDRVPEVERVVYFILSEIANEVTLLSKQLHFWLQPSDGEDEIESFARTSAGLTTAKLLAGRLYEAWNVLRAKEHGQVYTQYEPELDKDALDALKQIKRYFNTKTNIIGILRNKLAFHTDFEVMRAALVDFPNDEQLVNFIHKSAGNTFYNGAHLLAAVALKQAAGTNDLETAIGKVADDVVSVSGWFGKYVHGHTAVFSARYIEVLHLFSPPKKRTLDVPRFEEIRTPFYCEA